MEMMLAILFRWPQPLMRLKTNTVLHVHIDDHLNQARWLTFPSDQNLLVPIFCMNDFPKLLFIFYKWLVTCNVYKSTEIWLMSVFYIASRLTDQGPELQQTFNVPPMSRTPIFGRHPKHSIPIQVIYERTVSHRTSYHERLS